MLENDVSGVLEAINVDDASIAFVLSVLKQGEDIKSQALGKVGARSFGQSDAASLLNFHTDLAHQKVVEAMEDMVKGFTGLSENVVAFKRHFDDVDHGTHHSLTTGQSKVGDIPSDPNGAGS